MRKVWRSNRVDVSMIPEIEIARLSAFIDGEGSLSLTPSGRDRRYQYRQVRVVIGQADVRLMEYLFSTFGGRYAQGSGGTNRPMYYWMTEATYACALLQRCLPYFVMKREQAEVLLEYHSTVSINNRRPIPKEMAEQRETLKSRLTLLKHPERATA